MMTEQIDNTFIQLLNENMGIAHKVGRIYFSDIDDRQDAMQEMMYQLWKSYPRFDGRSKFSTWMYSVCLNTALTHKKKVKNEIVQPLSSAHNQIVEARSENREESITLLFDAMATLSPLNKAIVLLYLEEMSYEEIAVVMGLSKSNVSVRLVRIKRELEMQLKKQKINS